MAQDAVRQALIHNHQEILRLPEGRANGVHQRRTFDVDVYQRGTDPGLRHSQPQSDCNASPWVGVGCVIAIVAQLTRADVWLPPPLMLRLNTSRVCKAETST